MQAGLYTTPFPSGNRSRAQLESMYSAIQNRRFTWPNPLPAWAAKLPKMRNLIESLLVKDPTKRLGTARKVGIHSSSGDSIRTHDYFKEELPKLLKIKTPVDVDQIDKQWLTPPWVPTIAESNRCI